MDMNNFEAIPQTTMHEWIISKKGWKCTSERQISEHCCDFPQVDQVRQGYKTRYLYSVEFHPKIEGSFPYFKAILKYDLKTGEVVRHKSELNFSEAVFAPSVNRSNTNDDDEDKGYVIAMAHDETNNKSECYILDAKTMKIACRLSIPQRVPYGFHAAFIHPPNLLSKL